MKNEKTIEQLRVESDRYRQALEKIVQESSCHGEDCSWGDTCYGVIALKALQNP